MAYQLNEDLVLWLTEHALDLDQHSNQAQQILPRLAAANLLGLGIAPELGGAPNTTLQDAAWAVAEVAKHSLSAAFVLWAQRCFSSYLVLHPEATLSSSLISQAIAGEIAGATGLSNAIKFTGGIEGLQIQATPTADGWVLNGYLPWVSNLVPGQFEVMVAAERPDLPPAIFVLSHADVGLTRNDDLALHCIQHPEWNDKRIHFQPYPYPSYTRILVEQLQQMQFDQAPTFLEGLDPDWIAADLVDDRFVKNAIAQLGGLSAFGQAERYEREEWLV